MTLKVGLDTSFIIGLLDDRDMFHLPAVALQSTFSGHNIRPYVFDCVLSEPISTLARRTHEKRRGVEFAAIVEMIRQQFPAKAINWVCPDLPGLFDDVLALVQTSLGEINVNDALIAISCRNRKIPCAASFDTDFDQIPWLARLSTPEDLSAVMSG